MTLLVILGLSLLAFLAGWLFPAKGRVWVLLGLSLAALYGLQPSSAIRYLDFWLPGVSIFLTVFCWAIVRSRDQENRSATTLAYGIIAGSVLLVGYLRYFPGICCLTPTRPPALLQVSIGLGIAAMLIAIPYRLSSRTRWLSYGMIALLLGLMIFLKTEPLARQASAFLRAQSGQSSELASIIDLPWLGFSYLAFRLIHTLRDYQAGKLPEVSLGEYAVYALFFPAYPAGPIDRLQRFIPELRKPAHSALFTSRITEPSTGPQRKIPRPDYGNVLEGSRRILLGVFMKFFLADSLALFALNQQNALQSNSAIWSWILLYAYTLRIFFDFAGYTSIAIGIGRLMHIKLPENFANPYLKLNLTTFWNSWHITLAQWFRAYYFNPLTRSLRSRQPALPIWLTILLGQFSTMLLIGLWHGISWNFAIWGAWHGIGLFIHNRWLEWSRPYLPRLETQPALQRLLKFSSWLITINYVALGWVWFALPTPGLSMQVFGRLFSL